LPKGDAVIWRGPMLHKMIQDFLGLVDWGELDYLIIDLPPGTGDVQLSLCQTIPLTGAVVVSTPQDLALEVASKAIAMFRKLNTPVLGILENMSYYHCSHCGERDDIFGHGGARQASGELGYPFLGEIPLNSVIRERSDRGDPIALDRESEYGQAYRRIARGVAREIASANMVEPTEISIEI
jgi:ATP-binding protein involved in chromosome partitioning